MEWHLLFLQPDRAVMARLVIGQRHFLKRLEQQAAQCLRRVTTRAHSKCTCLIWFGIWWAYVKVRP